MKFLVFFTLCVFLSVTVCERPHYDLNKAQEYFNNFVARFHKHYRSDETIKRFNIFKENLNIINQLNAFNKSIYSITKFSDRSASEFKEQIGCLLPSPSLSSSRTGSCEAVNDEQLEGTVIPDTLDYRDRDCVTSVKDQGDCKSCWAFTTVGSLEGAYRIKHGELLTFSPQQLMDCLPSTGHCTEDGNTMRAAYQDLIGTEGVMLESDYPYVAEDEDCQYDAEKAKVKVTECTYFTLKDEEKLKEALVQNGPIGLGLDATTLQNYESGILDIETCPSATPNHAVLLIGYGTEDDKDYWLIKNSWGTDWGEEGYFRVARGSDVCGMHNNHASVAAVE